MYLMNRDGFSLLVMGFTGKEALDWKLKYIEAFNAMEKRINNQLALPDFTNPAEAARAWAEQFEAREKAQRTIEVMKVPAQMGEKFMACLDGFDGAKLSDLLSSRGVTYNGKPMGRTNLYKILKNVGLLFKRYDGNCFYQRYVDMGLGWTETNVTKDGKPYSKPMFTTKGLEYIVVRIPRWISEMEEK